MTINLFLDVRTVSLANDRNSSQIGLRTKGHSLARETRKSRASDMALYPGTPPTTPDPNPHTNLLTLLSSILTLFLENLFHMVVGWLLAMSGWLFSSWRTRAEGGFPSLVVLSDVLRLMPIDLGWVTFQNIHEIITVWKGDTLSNQTWTVCQPLEPEDGSHSTETTWSEKNLEPTTKRKEIGMLAR